MKYQKRKDGAIKFMAKDNYGEEAIQVLNDIEHVRLRKRDVSRRM